MKSRTIAIACAIAVLPLATAPVAAIAATTHQTKPTASPRRRRSTSRGDSRRHVRRPDSAGGRPPPSTAAASRPTLGRARSSWSETGFNDAPALAIADLGIAMRAAGAPVSSETADAVITVDGVDRLADAVNIGRRDLNAPRALRG